VPRVRATKIVVVAALLAACTSPTTPPPAPIPPTPGPTAIVLPPRPRELPLDGVDPCTLLTDAQRAQLGFDGGVVAGESTAPGFVGPSCVNSGYEPRAIAVVFALAVENGIEVLTGPGVLRDEVTVIDVAGFPALLARPKVEDSCSVDVDVARGQFLDVQFQDGGRSPAIPQDRLCRDAVDVAEEAVLTLLAR